MHAVPAPFGLLRPGAFEAGPFDGVGLGYAHDPLAKDCSLATGAFTLASFRVRAGESFRWIDAASFRWL